MIKLYQCAGCGHFFDRRQLRRVDAFWDCSTSGPLIRYRTARYCRDCKPQLSAIVMSTMRLGIVHYQQHQEEHHVL